MSSNWDALKTRLDGLKRPTQAFTICEDPEARQRLNRAKADLRDAEQTLAARPDDDANKTVFEDSVKNAKAELAAAQKAFDKVAVTLTFQALERKHLADLQAKHPATEEEEAQGEDFHMETFAPALISAASLDGMPVDYARNCLDTWAPGDAHDLWQAAWSVQNTRRTDLGKG